MEASAPTASNEPKKNIGLWIVGAIVVIGIIFALTRINNKSAEDEDDVTLSDEQETTMEMSSSTDTSPVDTSKATLVTKIDGDASLPYTSAFTKYAGRRIEFNSRCTMIPSKATFTAGTKIMLDNRGSMATTIVVGDNAYRIQAYNFAFITLADEGTLAVSCGSNANAGTITVK